MIVQLRIIATQLFTGPARHGIDATIGTGMTAKYAFHCQPPTPQWTMHDDGFMAVVRAARPVATAWPQHRADHRLIDTDDTEQWQ